MAKELFLPLDHFRKHVDAFPQCRPIVTSLEPRDDGQFSVEEELERLQSESERDGERIRQLTAIRYYLRNLIRDCQQKWAGLAGGASNYHALWDKIRRAAPILAVTFNYDTLFEEALAGVGIRFRKMSDYIEAGRPCRLIKPHGSIDWANLVETNSIPTVPVVVDEPYLIDRAASFKPTEVYELIDDQTKSPDDPRYGLWPALAIPTISKLSFACPKDHLDAFRESAREVDKILIIGWRGAEKHFLKELATSIRWPVVHVCAVCETEEAANEPLESLRAVGIHGNFEAYPLGFSGFVRSRRAEAFLSATL